MKLFVRKCFCCLFLAVFTTACGDGTPNQTSDAGASVDVDAVDVEHDANDVGDAGHADADTEPGPVFGETVSAGTYHSCAILNDGELRCFGLGDVWGTHEGLWDLDQSVEPDGEFVQVSSGTLHSCGIKADGAVECWGHGRLPGRAEAPSDYDFDQAVPPEGTFLAVDAGPYATCGVRDDRTVKCWGWMSGPEDLVDGEARQVSVGYGHMCAVMNSGEVECVGYGSDAEASDGQYHFGQAAPPAGEFVQVSAGHFHSCGVRRDGTVSCWGLGSDAEVREHDFDHDQAVAPEGRFRWVAAGRAHSCGVREDGDVECWGFGAEPGPADLRDRGHADARQGPFVEVSTWNWHTCGRRESGEVECWGNNGLGQADPDSEYGADGCERVDHGDYGIYGCSPLCQTGCGEGQACILTWTHDVGYLTRCTSPGINAPGEMCSPSAGLCEAGSGCITDGGLEGTCRAFCRNDGDAEPQCPSGYRCTGSVSIGTCRPR
ncbi:hypothetical protein FIV42_14680 [Persicimonas caeni]|uniref:non-specific serine/threonine protein kinase n=1 Tax=Persicimonas caeni TaxID=2292766 RepID=A0A4Y6PUF7_PERCE|nr:RCC1 domain-containing protein [Persicimonas caeni]QDG51938.1 hypothetical protein FIV42_14680 [Persicimonas caeni]QED33159.1 hypothetical protein FRD00_14675 [Persicimonas caeni]